MTETAIASKITFAEYMEQALYGPQGYYATGQARSGREGDYFTAPDVGPAFGQLLALIFQDWEKKLGLSPFRLVEAGPGEGALAESIRRVWSAPYLAIERSPARRAKLKSLDFEVLPGLEALATRSVSGCLFANELLDAFPVHHVRIQAGKLQEAYVEDEQLVWGSPSSPQLQAYLDRIKIDLPEGYQTEINLAMADWFRSAARGLQKGLLVLIDYGRPAAEYYAPERNQGTLRGFHKHQVVDVAGPRLRGGNVDLTVDVDFTSAALDAEAAGFQPLAFMELGSFLMTGVQQLPASEPAPKGLKYLIHPDGLGSQFHVLILGKDVPLTEKDFPHNRIQRLGI